MYIIEEQLFCTAHCKIYKLQIPGSVNLVDKTDGNIDLESYLKSYTYVANTLIFIVKS